MSKVPNAAPAAAKAMPIEPATSLLKRVVKAVLHYTAVLVLLPLLALFRLQAFMIGRDRALENASQTLALVPGMSGKILRRAFLAQVFPRCDRTADIGFGTLFSQAGSVIEEHVYIGPGCFLGWVHLEKDVLIAAGVHIPSGAQTHYFDDPARPIREQGGERVQVRIGAGCWIGSGAIVMADVGRGTVIAAGAVVTKPLPEFVIAGGVPAKVLRPRFTETPPTLGENAER